MIGAATGSEGAAGPERHGPPAGGPFGVYGLANRAVEPWFEGWIRSLRRFNPELPVWVIPFDADLGRIPELCERFDARILPGSEVVRFDELGRRHFPGETSAPRTYRKLAMFSGPLETFLFLDADVVVLDDLRPLLEVFERSRRSVVYFDTDLDQVYLPGLLRERMVAEYSAVGVNTGALLGRRGALSEAELALRFEESLEVRGELKRLYEQPFLSYCLERSRVPMADVREIAPELGPTWIGWPEALRSENVGPFLGRTEVEPGRRSPFLHWAGVELTYKMPLAPVYLAFAPLRLRSRLWLRYVAGAVRRRLRV